MPAIVNFGSLNIDHVYRVNHFVRPGETLDSQAYDKFPGGKGFNQSVALARAGIPVRRAGKIGPDGRWLKQYLAEAGADTTFVEEVDGPTGHAIIQVTPKGENSIVLQGRDHLRHPPGRHGVNPFSDRFLATTTVALDGRTRTDHTPY